MLWKLRCRRISTRVQDVVAGNAAASHSLEVAGPGTITFRPPISQSVQAQGSWKDGRWTVVMTRPLKVESGGGVSLEPGRRVSIAFAVWDGAQRDRDGKKVITIWQDLVLEK
jgi:DMSO reductase family type II enzyme heme b subunit